MSGVQQGRSPLEIADIDKKYSVLRELGRGSNGTVYLATDPQGTKFAIKCLASQCNVISLKRLKNEFTLLRTLKHPHIAQPLDFGFDENLKRHFLVAEYVEGECLDAAVEKLTEDQALHLLDQALRALDYMHRQGVFHCDLKPGNILVTPSGILKILDFDVAVRGSVAIGGTPSYCAPELMMDENAPPTPRSDLFSLGVTFYHALTRSRPYAAKSLKELIVAYADGSPPLPSKLRPGLSGVWDGVLLGMLQPQPSQRYATASGVLQQLHPHLGHRKFSFSAEDIDYRLRQHGLPIGKESALKEIRSFLNTQPTRPEDRILILEAEEGCGASYSAAEIKAMAQLMNIPCYMSDFENDRPPKRFPFLWIIDDVGAVLKDSHQEWANIFGAWFEEFSFRGEGKPWWVILTGLKAGQAKAFGKFFKTFPHRLSLTPWSEEDTQRWLEDIFQTKDIPPFLASHLHGECMGNPKLMAHRLSHYLKLGYLLDARGEWRKDLFHPNDLFLQKLSGATPSEGFAASLTGLNELEIEILEWLAFGYPALPEKILEELLPGQRVHTSLRRLLYLGVTQELEEGVYRIISGRFRDFLLAKFTDQEKESRHQIIADLAKAEPSGLSEEALLFHRAHALDSLDKARAWRDFGESSGRKGLWQSAGDYFQKALECAPDAELRFQCSIDIGRSLLQGGRNQEARVYFEDLLNTLRSEKRQNPSFMAKIYERLGVIERKEMNLEKAREYFASGVSCLGSDRGLVEQVLGLKNFIAELELASGNYDGAIEIFTETFRLAQTLPWEIRRILTNNDLGAALMKAGRSEEAIAHWNSQLEDLKLREDKIPWVRCLYQLGQVFAELHQNEKALAYLQQAKAALPAIRSAELEIRIFNALANLAKESHPAKALENYELALDAAFRTHDPFSTGVVLLNMGFLLAEMKQLARARHCLIQGLSYLEKIPQAEQSYSNLLVPAREEIEKLNRNLEQKQGPNAPVAG
jgi:Serine/threonine protein kinase